MRHSQELQSEHARDLICAWALATEAVLGIGDPDKVEAVFQTARRQAEGWSDEHRSSQLLAVADGGLPSEIFNPEFIRRYRRARVVPE
jgi:hypothetical protein